LLCTPSHQNQPTSPKRPNISGERERREERRGEEKRGEREEGSEKRDGGTQKIARVTV